MSSTSAPARHFPRPFGSYVLLGSLGRGGMGEVFLARRGQVRGAERLCVLKTMRTDVAADQEYAKRFLDEARLAVNLAHANICHVFDVGRVDNELYLAMEHIAGITLRAFLDALERTERSLSTPFSIHIACELLDALDYAHRRVHPVTQQPLSIVHRDVSPQNVMVTFEGELKLIDFGLALSRLKSEETSAEVVMGKLAYMSPEQMRGESVDPRTDQFAAAIMLYEMLAARRYYGDLDRAAVVAAAMSGAYRPAGFADLDADLQAILAKALAPNKEDRYASCDKLARDLRTALADRHLAVARGDLRELIQAALPSSSADHAALVSSLAQASTFMDSASTLLSLSPVPDTTTEAESVSQPTVVVAREVPAPRPPRTRTRIYAALGFAAVAAVALAVVFVNRPGEPDDARVTPPIAPAARVVTPDAGVHEAAAPQHDADAGVLAKNDDEPQGPVEDREPRGRVKKRAVAAPPTPHVVMPPVDVMWRTLESCPTKQKCATGFVAARATEEPPKALLYKCYRQCIGLKDVKDR